MRTVFFPSCKVKQAFPRQSELLYTYLQSKIGAESGGCCRVGHKSLSPLDEAIVICLNCSCIVTESSLAKNIRFVWDIIDEDRDFPFPDYGGKRIAVQDCWLTHENRHLQETVRSVLRKMNLTVVELENNFEKTRFCGPTILSPCLPGNALLAPKRYDNGHSDIFNPMDEEHQISYFKNYCQAIPTDDVATYCRSCTQGIQMGGKTAHHLLELAFPLESI